METNSCHPISAPPRIPDQAGGHIAYLPQYRMTLAYAKVLHG